MSLQPLGHAQKLTQHAGLAKGPIQEHGPGRAVAIPRSWTIFSETPWWIRSARTIFSETKSPGVSH